jgi:hypothetical protein
MVVYGRVRQDKAARVNVTRNWKRWEKRKNASSQNKRGKRRKCKEKKGKSDSRNV